MRPLGISSGIHWCDGGISIWDFRKSLDFGHLSLVDGSVSSAENFVVHIWNFITSSNTRTAVRTPLRIVFRFALIAMQMLVHTIHTIQKDQNILRLS